MLLNNGSANQEVPANLLQNVFNNLDDVCKSKLLEFCQLVSSHKKVNLTAFKTESELLERFILESLIFRFINIDYDLTHTLDIGSGAGIPGVVIAICEPKTAVYSIDKSQKKINFQNSICSSLKIPNFNPICCLEQDYQPEQEFTAVLFRAYKSLDRCLQSASRLLKKEGVCILWKGKKWADELADCSLDILSKYKPPHVIRYHTSKLSGGFLLVFRFSGV